MKKYVVGFMFSEDGNNVVLIRKNKPEWQAGKLNGVGGKVEDFDKTTHGAMSREFFEETSVQTNPLDWTKFAHFEGTTCHIDFFAMASDYGYNEAKTNTAEEIIKLIYPLFWEDIDKMIPNVKWLLQFARQYVLHIEGPECLSLPVNFYFEEGLYKEGKI